MASSYPPQEGDPGPDLSTFPPSLRGKRILLCTESFGPVNGVSRTTLMLVNHLRSNGAIVTVVAPQNHTSQNTFVPLLKDTVQQPTTASQTHSPEIRIQGYPLPYNPELSIVYPVRLSTLYNRTFDGSPPDLIYLASPASLGFQVMLQLRQQPAESQVPIICNFQTDLSGYCQIIFPQPLSDLAVFIFGSVQSFLFNHASVRTIFYPSRFVRRYLEGRGVGGDKLELLQRGVDTEVFHPAKRSEMLRREIAPDGEIILLCVARLAPEKGFGFLAEVVRRLGDKGVRFKLYIVGGNRNAAVEGEIRGFFDDGPMGVDGKGKVKWMGGKVVFAGFLVGEELAAAYASADLFLHCSITETFGLVVLESMASGVPVVARDEGGPSDIVRHGESGYLVPPDEVDMFVERVVMVAGDEELRGKLRVGARKQAEEMGWDRVNNKVAWRMEGVIDEWEMERERRRDMEMVWEHDEDGDVGVDADLERGPLVNVGGDGVTLRAATSNMRTTTSMWKSWVTMEEVIRARLVDARLVGGMTLISAAWVAVGGYLAFIKSKLWLRERFWS